jgi:hypothetical protein
VDAERRQRQGGSRERAEGASLVAAGGRVVAHDVRHRLDVRHRDLRIRPRDDLAERRQERRRGYGGADGQLFRCEPGKLVVAELSGGQVDLWFALPLETAHANVADDADDRPFLEGEEEMFPDRVLAGPHLLPERLAHDGHVG